MGRFLNCDDTAILLATQGETHNANLFAYCNNNPVNSTDPTGKYSPSKAQKYADAWWDSYNPNYKKNTSDCANFVSQCLYAGGLSSMTASWNNIYFKVQVGTYYEKVGFWYIKMPIYQNFGNISGAWGQTNKLRSWLLKNNYAEEFVFCNKDELYLLAFFLLCIDYQPCMIVGFLDWGDDNDTDSTKYNHSVILGEVSPIDLEIYYYGHTAARNGRRLQNGKINSSLQDIFNNHPNAEISLCVIKR